MLRRQVELSKRAQSKFEHCYQYLVSASINAVRLRRTYLQYQEPQPKTSQLGQREGTSDGRIASSSQKRVIEPFSRRDASTDKGNPCQRYKRVLKMLYL